MTGTIYKLANQKTFCFIRGENSVEYYAHMRDFPDPSVMTLGRLVSFSPKLASIPGKPHPVTDVVALERKAA
jgi:hypothetical protein